MSIPIPLRADFNATRLRRLARDSKEASQARRLLALATIYAGGMRTQAAEVGGVQRRGGDGVVMKTLIISILASCSCILASNGIKRLMEIGYE